MSEPTLTNGLRAKDISDWIKIALVIGSMLVGYVKLSDQVSGHTEQISDVQEQIGKMRDENRTRNTETQKKIGAIQMYLCSKDSTHCDPTSIAPTQ